MINNGKHHSKLLWGDDCMEFNPDRNFCDDEIWGGESFRAFDPSSGRYHPFQYAPDKSSSEFDELD